MKNQSSFEHLPARDHPPSRLRSWLIGRPLPTADAAHQAINKRVGLAVFASDALSSTAYATQEILIILAAAGTIAYGFTFPIAVAIVILLAIVTISYQQTIHAYEGGGGAYIVSRDNLGILPAQTAGAALLTDYILTVAVSVSAGIAQVVSAFPTLFPYRVPIAISIILIIMVINLRGVRESGVVFAIPTYFFLGMILLTLGVGGFRLLQGSLTTVIDPPHIVETVLAPVSLFLILRAFSSGTTALTGVEAISNGISAFEPPRSHNAAKTLVWMAVILGTVFLGITYLALQVEVVPSEVETVISQLVRTIYNGRGFFYLITIGATTLILFMAANTAFADFPRLGALMAADKFLPRQFTYKGSRLVYSWGIVALALLASLLILMFQASVTALIPLYAIGVFMSFSLSQTGMARRWGKIGKLALDEEVVEPGSTLKYEKGWKWKRVVNAFGAVCTSIVMMIFAVTKFREGAWVVLIIIPALVFVFKAINNHYQDLAERLSLSNLATPPSAITKQRVIVLVDNVHQGVLSALKYAQILGGDVTAVHVGVNEDMIGRLKERWAAWGEDVPLVIIESPFRELFHPLVSYIDEAVSQMELGEIVTVVVPQFVPRTMWHNLLHMQTASLLRWALLHRKGVIVVDVPYQVS